MTARNFLLYPDNFFTQNFALTKKNARGTKFLSHEYTNLKVWKNHPKNSKADFYLIKGKNVSKILIEAVFFLSTFCL